MPKKLKMHSFFGNQELCLGNMVHFEIVGSMTSECQRRARAGVKEKAFSLALYRDHVFKAKKRSPTTEGRPLLEVG